MKNSVYQNASIVTGLSVAERCLGFLYRIVLSRFIGAEGLGLYQVSLSLFTLFLTFATGGIPVTVSKMIAKSRAEGNPDGEKSALSAGLFLSLAVALPLSLCLFTFGNKLTFLFSSPQIYRVFRVLAVGLCFACVYAVIRGYFWGKKRFLAPSLLECGEEVVMVLFGIFLLRGVPSPSVGAERAAWAVVLSYLFAAVAALLCFFFVGGRFSSPKRDLKPLFSSAMPITSVRTSGSLVSSAISVLLPAALVRAGMDAQSALKAVGVLSGMVLPVLFIPSTLIGSLALVLVPELSEDYHKNNAERLKRNVERGLRFAFLVACMLLPFFFAFGEDIGALAFSSPLAGRIISKSCVILLPMSLTMISTSMLNSVGFEKQTFVFYFFGAAALLACVLILPPVCGIYAYVVGLGASYLVTAACNLVLLYKHCRFFEKRWGQVCVRLLFPALVAVLPISLFSQFTLAFCKRYLGERLCLPLSALAAALLTLLVYLSARLVSAKTLRAPFSGNEKANPTKSQKKRLF